MVRRSWLLTGAALALATLWPSGAGALKAPTGAQVRPHAFGSCAALVGYAQTHLKQTHGYPEPPIVGVAVATSTGAKGVVGAAPSAAASADGGTTSSPSFSTTNNQEEGVDEPDIAKTDGSTIFAIAGGKLRAVAAGGATPRLLGTLDLGPSGYGSQLLLRGNRLIVVSGQLRSPIGITPMIANAPASIRSSPYFIYGSTTTLTEVNISDPAAMKVTQTMTVDGRFVDARQSGSSARIVISSAPPAVVQPQLAGGSSGWVPTRKFNDVRTGRHFTRPVAACNTIRRPVDFSGLGMLSIVTVNFDKGLGVAHSDSLMADAQIVYGSTSNLYVATQKWVNPALAVGQLPSSQTTVIDQFEVSDPDTTKFVSSGEVPGYLLNQFSLSEYRGYLRVASTSRPIWWGGVSSGVPPLSQSFVTVLASKGGVLAPVGQVSGLGQGEQIYSVRFVDDTGYVVTFRQVDPLYTIDLSSPTAPKVAGQLELEGYSAYLHPVGDGLLLGVGVDVSSDSNEPSGAQVELFDVADAAHPKLLSKASLGAGSSTQATYDHHAFLYWQPTGLAVLPMRSYVATPVVSPGGTTSSSQGFTGAIGFHVARAGGISTPVQFAQDPVNGVSPEIERAIVIGSTLYTLSDAGVMASSLGTLARQAFVAFPAA
jgi:Beta propeller domain